MAKHAKTGKGLARRGKRREAGGLFRTVGSALSEGFERVARAMSPNDDFDALDLLKAQHRGVDRLFHEIRSATGPSKASSFRELADMLTVHATIEEWIFYPNVRNDETEDLLAESTEEHLAMKRTLADMLDEDVAGETFDAKLNVLEEQVHHHAIEEEEGKLFPKVRAAKRGPRRDRRSGPPLGGAADARFQGAPDQGWSVGDLRIGVATIGGCAPPIPFLCSRWFERCRGPSTTSRCGRS